MAEPTEKQKIGRLGEDIAVKYLENKGFSVIERNYLKKCGEIDIIAKKAEITHFIEVKSVTESPDSEPAGFTAWPQTPGRSENCGKNVSLRPRREFANSVTDKYRPEDNLHQYKLKRLARTIQLYLFEKHANGEPEWVFDVITVQIDTKTRQAHVKFLRNIVL